MKMKTRLLAFPQWEPRVVRTALLLSVAMLVSLLSAEETMAQRPFQRLRRGFDAIRPGWIIPHASEDAASGSAKTPEPSKSAPKSSKKSDDSDKQPTEAPAEGAPKPSLVATAGNVDDPSLLELIPPGAPDDFGAKIVAEKDESIAIEEIDPEGAASAADLQVGDIIRNVGGITIGSVEALKGITEELSGGVVVEFEIVRAGKELKKDVQFGSVSVDDVPEDSLTPIVAPPAAPESPALPPKISIPPLAVSKAHAIGNLQSILTSTPAEDMHLPSALAPSRTPPSMFDFSTPVPEEKATPELDNSLEQLLDFDVDEAR